MSLADTRWPCVEWSRTKKENEIRGKVYRATEVKERCVILLKKKKVMGHTTIIIKFYPFAPRHVLCPVALLLLPES